MDSFTLLEQEFQSFIPFNSEDPLAPFTSEMSYEEKLNVTSRALRRSIKLRNRVTTLVNAFYLGYLFNQAGSTAKEFKAKNSTTKHYATMAEYTFNIFEEDPSQIYQTNFLTAQTIKKMKREQILQLRTLVEKNVTKSFDGAQSLGEENC